jgi:hypothetical protein
MQMNRREFLVATGAAASRPLVSSATVLDPAGGQRKKAPFRTLYNNDCTNLLSCFSPWSNPSNNSKPEVFSPKLIEASVAEVAGLVDVQLFCPGLCWVPWWKSEVYPAKQHYLWYYQLIGQPAGPYDAYARYMMDGGDMVQEFLDACRRRGQTAFVSFRLNDVQFLETINNKVVMTSKMAKFWYENSAYVTDKSYTLGNDYSKNPERAQNWAIPQVRDYKLSLLKEICKYDIDGLELDFNRYANYFPPESDAGEIQAIMVGFIRQVRAALDEGRDPRTQNGGSPQNARRRYLCVRVPSFVDVYPNMGISLPDFVKAGVDMVNFSDGYFTTNESDLSVVRSLIPQTSIYFEATQTTNWTAKFPDGSTPFLRTTDQQFHTVADVAYKQGADGISLFNFVYYRQTSNEIATDPGVGPFNEPPFHVLDGLRHPDYVSAEPRWHVLAVDHDTYISPSMQMPQTLQAGKSTTFKLSMYPKGKQADAVLRVRVAPPSGHTGGPVPAWTCLVELNNAPLDPTSYVSAPLPDPYSANLAVDPSRFCCFKASSAAVVEGQNAIKVTLVQPTAQSAGNVTLDYLDLSWP